MADDKVSKSDLRSGVSQCPVCNARAHKNDFGRNEDWRVPARGYMALSTDPEITRRRNRARSLVRKNNTKGLS